jgi:hypothetical protein
MRFAPTLLGAAAAAVLLLAPPGRPLAQTGDQTAARKAAEERKTADEVAKLREQLGRVNAKIAELKRADRSVRVDYRLRDSMADAEALAQQLSRAEALLRSLRGPVSAEPRTVAPPPLPAESPNDGSVELEAKAALFSDQASRLEQQADLLTLAAERMRARKLLRQRASVWDRDPFGGLESSNRSLAASAATAVPKGGTGSVPGGYGPASPVGSGSPSATTSSSNSGQTAAMTITSTPTGAPVSISTTSGSTISTDTTRGTTSVSSSGVASESSTSKSPPLAAGLSPDHLSDLHLYLDPTMAAEVREALSAASSTSDPSALARAAAILRARARELARQAERLERKSQAP